MIIDAKQAFNIVADGSDETTKINQALAVATGENAGELVYFPPGVYGCDGLDVIDNVASFFGAGPRRTTFKNLSPDERLFEFSAGDPQTNPLGTAFSRVGGFSVDQNGSTGDGFRLNKMYSRLYDIWLKEQAGNGWAVNAKNCTLSRLMDDVHISRSTNGVFLDNCFYPRLSNVSIERTNGVALKSDGSIDVEIDHLYLDHGPGGTTGDAPELVQILNGDSLFIRGLTMELASAANLAPNRYMLFENFRSASVKGFRVNQYAAESSAYMFYAKDAGLSIESGQWYCDQHGMVFVGAEGDGSDLVLREIETYYNQTSISRYAIGCWEGPIRKIVVDGWHDRKDQTQAWPSAATIDMKNYNFVVKP